MTIGYTQLDANTGTFGSWLARTNALSEDMTNSVVTVGPVATPNTTNGATSTGNAHVEGMFSANTFIVGSVLRGGTHQTPASFSVTSPVVFAGQTVSLSSNTTFSGDVVLSGVSRSLTVNTASTSIRSPNVNFTGNVALNGPTVANTFSVSGAFNVNTSTIESLSANVGDINTLDVDDLNVVDLDISGDFTTASLTINSTGGAKMPVGNTAQRPSANSIGSVRFNSTTGKFEGNDGSVWAGLDGNLPIPTSEDTGKYLTVAGDKDYQLSAPTILSGNTWNEGVSSVETSVSPAKIYAANLAFAANRTFVSSWINIANSGVYTLSHGLGDVPGTSALNFKNLDNADGDYFAGQIIESAISGGTWASGVSLIKSNTQLILRIGFYGPGEYVRRQGEGNFFMKSSAWQMQVISHRFLRD